MTEIGATGLWPIEKIREALSEEEFLVSLCGPRRAGPGFDTREGNLERLIRSIVGMEVAGAEFLPAQMVGQTLAIPGTNFPLHTRPDVMFRANGEFHLGEVKSGRVDDNRHQCVVGRAMREYLTFIGHRGSPPWEVEQDILRLLAFMSLGTKVRSATLFLVDAYQGRGKSWSRSFQSEANFVEEMRTEFVRKRAHYLLSSTRIYPLSTPSLRASLIVCILHQ